MSIERIALVTGANRGLGFEVAKGLAVAGHHVLLGSRDLAKGEAAVGALGDVGRAEAIRLDTTDLESFGGLAEALQTRFGRLDVLVNNAGVSLDWTTPPSASPIRLLRDTLEPNLFGVVALTQALLPLILQSKAGRIVNVSSSLGSLGCASDPDYAYYGFNAFAYTASKAALNAWTVALAKELRDTSIKVNSGDPGWCRTELGGVQAPLSPEMGAAALLPLAELPDDGPNGGFFHGLTPVRW